MAREMEKNICGVDSEAVVYVKEECTIKEEPIDEWNMDDGGCNSYAMNDKPVEENTAVIHIIAGGLKDCSSKEDDCSNVSKKRKRGPEDTLYCDTSPPVSLKVNQGENSELTKSSNAEIMEFITTKRGGIKLLLDGYAYIVDKKKYDITYWRCERRGSCGGRLRTEDNIIQGEVSNHSHPPDAGRNLFLKTLQEIKERATQSEEVTSAIMQNCPSEYPVDIADALSKKETLVLDSTGVLSKKEMRVLHNAGALSKKEMRVLDTAGALSKKETQVLHTAGGLSKKETLARMLHRQRGAPDGDFLTDDLRKSIGGDDFVIHESDNLLMLSTPRNLQLLACKDHWVCDGTLDSAPIGFELYTVHVMLDETHTIPLVYCITRNKNQATYDLIFNTLKQVRPDLNPVSVTIDFERAALNSIKGCFPNTNLYGYYFHFGHCLLRQIQLLGLQTWYDDPRNELIVKSFQALAFVPVSDVAESFNELISTLDDETDELLSEFLGYFEATWIGVIQRGRRRRPAFDIRLWNVLERNREGFLWTINSLEGWHRGFEQRMAIKHPSVCRLVTKLRKEQSNWELTIEQAAAGMILRASKKDRLLNTRLNSIIENYEQSHIVDFLRAIARNL